MIARLAPRNLGVLLDYFGVLLCVWLEPATPRAARRAASFAGSTSRRMTNMTALGIKGDAGRQALFVRHAGHSSIFPEERKDAVHHNAKPPLDHLR